jgi:LAGLIDADG endonuclease
MRSDAGPWSSREFLSVYISGYADGEGCFTVSISPRAKLLVGWEVRPSFSVSQNGDRAEVLHALQAYFGCGSIRPDRSDKTLKWETRRHEDLLDRVIPHSSVTRFSRGRDWTSSASKPSVGYRRPVRIGRKPA